MKVMVYTPFWVMGGIERVILTLLAEFERNGEDHQFILLTESPPDPGNQFELPANAVLYSRKLAPFTEKSRLALREFVHYHDPDVVVAMGSSRRLYYVSRALVDSPYPVILSEHNADKVILRNYRSDWRFLNAVRNTADICHVLSEAFALQFDDGVDVRVISNPVTPADTIVSETTLDTANTIICTSRYDWHQKQPDVLVRAFADVAPDFPDWRLEFYGADWNDGKARLQALVDELGLTSRVKLNDPTDDVPSALLGASIFAFPSAYEGFGLSLFEAMAHGLPCVITNFTGMPTVVKSGHSALIAPGGVRDVEGLSDALRTLMADKAARRELSRGALECANSDELSLHTFYTKWKAAFADAAALKGTNGLANLSPMERAYIQNMTSGLLYDQLHTARIDARQHDKTRKILRRFGLLRIAERVGVKLAG